MNKKVNKKFLVIIIIIVIILVLLGIILYLLNRDNSPNEQYWGEIYSNYLKNEIFSVGENNNYILKDGLQKVTIEFIDIKEANPILAVSYEKDNKKLSDFYEINSKLQVENKLKEKEGNLDFLYDIQRQDYLWYFHTVDEENNNYISIKNLIQGVEKTEYTMTNSDFSMANSEDSKVTYTVTKFDETFVKPDIEKNSLEIENTISQDEFENMMNNLAINYKTISQIITENVKAEVAEKLEEIEENKKKIAQAGINNNEGNTVKSQNVNEETRDYMQAGNFKLEYGTYTSNLGENQAKAGSYILNKDKSFQYTNTWKDSTNTPHQINITGTYSIYYSEDIDVEGWIIKFTSNSDESMGNTLYSINSNNSFEGIQYPNTFSLAKNDNTSNNTEDQEDGEGLNVGKYNLKYGMYTYKLRQIFLYNTQTYRIKDETGSFKVEGNNIILDNGMVLEVNGNDSFVYDDFKYQLKAESKNQ